MNETLTNSTLPSATTWDILLTVGTASVNAALETILGILIGTVLSHPKFGILSEQAARKFVSMTILYVMSPLLFLKSMGQGIDIALLKSVWICPVFCIVLVIIQTIVGLILFPSFGLLRGDTKRKIAILSVGWSNSGYYVMVFLSSLMRGYDFFFVPDAEDKMMGIVTLFTLPAGFYFYSVVWAFYGNSKDAAENEEEREEVEMEGPLETKNKGGIKCGVLKKIGKGVYTFLKRSMSPPFVGCVVGLTMGIIPKVGPFLFDSNPPIITAFMGIVVRFGDSTLTMAMIITGANLGMLLFDPAKVKKLHSGPSGKTKPPQSTTSSKFLGFFKGLWKYVQCENITMYHVTKSVIGKLIIMPIISLFLTLLMAITFGDLIITDENIRPLVYIILVVEGAVPLGMNLNLLVTIFKRGVADLAELMLVQYFLCPITMAIFTIIGLFVICSREKCNF